MPAGNVLETLVLQMRAQVAEGVKGIQAINNKLDKLGNVAAKTAQAFKLLAAVGLGGSFTILGRALALAASEAQRFATQIGATVEEVSALSRVTASAGVETSEFRKALRQLIKNTESAKDGLGEFVRIFDKLNIDAAKLQQQDLNVQLAILARAFRELESDAQRTAVAMRLFGESGDVMVSALQQGEAAFLSAQQTFKGELLTTEEAIRFKELDATMTRLAAKTGAMGQKLLAPFTEALKDIAMIFEDTIDFFFPPLRVLMEFIGGTLGAMTKMFRAFGAGVRDVLETIGIDFEGMGDSINEFADEIRWSFEKATRIILAAIFTQIEVIVKGIETAIAYGQVLAKVFSGDLPAALEIGKKAWENWQNLFNDVRKDVDELMGDITSVGGDFDLPDVSPDGGEEFKKIMREREQLADQVIAFGKNLRKQADTVGKTKTEVALLEFEYSKLGQTLKNSGDPELLAWYERLKKAIGDVGLIDANQALKDYIDEMAGGILVANNAVSAFDKLLLTNKKLAAFYKELKQAAPDLARQFELDFTALHKTSKKLADNKEYERALERANKFVDDLGRNIDRLNPHLTTLDKLKLKYKGLAEDLEKIRAKDPAEAKRIEEDAVALVKFGEQMEANRMELQRMQEIGREVGAIFGSAFEEALISGQRFQDFLEDLANDLLRFGTRELVTRPLMEGFGEFFGGLSGKQDSTATSGTGMLANLGKFFGNLFNFFEEGGFPQIGKPAVVGESGPEVFIPRVSGVVIPGNQMNSLGNTTINLNVTTPDVDSFRQSQSQLMADLNRMSRNAHRRFK